MHVFNKLTSYEKLGRPAKAAIWYTFCNILQKGVAFLVVPVYIRFLTAAEFGKYAVFNSWINILIIFATLNLYCGVFTKAMVDYPDDRDRYTSSMQGLSTILTSLLFVVYLISPALWNRTFDMDPKTSMMMFLYFLSFSAFSFWGVRQRVEYKYKRMVLVTIVLTLLTPAISLLLLKYTTLKENAVIWGFLTANILVGIIFYFYQFFAGRCFYHKRYWLNAIKYNIPLIPHYLSLIVLGQSDRIMIKELCGEAESGIYTLAYQVSIAMNLITNAVNQAIVPWIYEKLKKRDYLPISDLSLNLCYFIGGLTVLLMLIAPEIIKILGTKEYYLAVWIVPTVAMSGYYTFCYNLFSTAEFYFSATKYVMIASITGSLMNIFLNAVFIPKFGFIAAGYTTLISYFALMLMHYTFMKKICSDNNIDYELFNSKKLGISMIFLFLIMLICLWSYNYVYIRYSIIIATLFIFAGLRKKIINAFESLKLKTE